MLVLELVQVLELVLVLALELELELELERLVLTMLGHSEAPVPTALTQRLLRWSMTAPHFERGACRSAPNCSNLGKAQSAGHHPRCSQVQPRHGVH